MSYSVWVWDLRNSDPEALRRWQTGQTGYPLIDAGMRESPGGMEMPFTSVWVWNRMKTCAKIETNDCSANAKGVLTRALML